MLGDMRSSSTEPDRPAQLPSRLGRAMRLVLSSLLLFVAGFMALPKSPAQSNILPTLQASPTPSNTPRPTLPPATATPKLAQFSPPVSPEPPFSSPLAQGFLLLSLNDGGYSHLFAFQPMRMPFTRLTYGPWNDISPAVSPDGKQVAFASNRDGQWDLYILSLSSGETSRFTDTPQYDGSPSWSPDGSYLAYETYGTDLEVVIQTVKDQQLPIPLSESPAADHSPAWSPGGREIAFISTRSGEPEVWLANLDTVGADRFKNISQRPLSNEFHPAWSASGQLAWASVEAGTHSLYWVEPGGEQRYLGSGDWPAWSPDGRALLTSIDDPNQIYLSAYSVPDAILALPPLSAPGAVAGLDWSESSFPEELPAPLAEAALRGPEPLWEASLLGGDDVPGGRQRLAELAAVEAPYPQLHDLVDEAFQVLRQRAAQESGWDFLSVLENAYVPITAPLSPGLGQDWLYTGRAFAFSSAPLAAAWMVLVPEQFGADTYWRVFLRARSQDGSQGLPLKMATWDLNARYSGRASDYEQGGRLDAEIPAGYWIDFTGLASIYGWQRLPALATWRSDYSAARFNEFVCGQGQDWQAAMLEIYPPEALVTPTVAMPPTLTPTRTPAWTLQPPGSSP